VVCFNKESNGVAEECDGSKGHQDSNEAHVWSGTNECELDGGNIFGEVLAIESN
jgi:hypothetical protein